MYPPQGGGIKKLSELLIDLDKDWAAKNITNFGAGGIDLHGVVTGHASRHASGGADAIPAAGIARRQLEYPTTDVTLFYLAVIDKLRMVWSDGHNMDRGIAFVTVDDFTDKGLDGVLGDIDVDHKNSPCFRFSSVDNCYYGGVLTASTTADFRLEKVAAGTVTNLGYEGVDIGHNVYNIRFTASGSTLKGYRSDLTTAKISVTDTSFSTGKWGMWGDDCVVNHGAGEILPLEKLFWKLIAASSPSPKCIGYYEVPVIGKGTIDDPYRAALPEIKEIPTTNELDGYDEALRNAIKSNKDEKVNRIAVSHSALIPTDPITGKPLHTTCIVRIFEQTSRQPHLWSITEAVSKIEKQATTKKYDRPDAITRAKQLDTKLMDSDLLAYPSPSESEIKKYVKERKRIYDVDTDFESARRYLEDDKGW